MPFTRHHSVGSVLSAENANQQNTLGSNACRHVNQQPPRVVEEMARGSASFQRSFSECSAQNTPSSFLNCCVPTGCDPNNSEPIHNSNPAADGAVRVVCNNENCTQSGWMHSDCFENWQQHVLAFLKSSGRARGWSEKQRMQNMWTKKGYDLVYKACECRCGRGHLRKDLDYVAPSNNVMDESRNSVAANGGARKKNRKQQQQQQSKQPISILGQNTSLNGRMGGISSQFGSAGSTGKNGAGGSFNNKPHLSLRVRTSSISSTGSSPPSSAGTPPFSHGSAPSSGGSTNGNGAGGASSAGNSGKFSFFANADQAAAGNIFKRRADFSAFEHIPRIHQNPYHIKMEDEGPYGNDETRCFLLANLSNQSVTAVECVVCAAELVVFDRYPLIDGTFFLSPLRYRSDLQVLFEHKTFYLNAVCMRCMEGERHIRCLACKTPWSGRHLVLGTMYSYDVFAAQPCCAHRLTCKHCRRGVVDPGRDGAAAAYSGFYSHYSRVVSCPHCHRDDYHFIKPLAHTFYFRLPSTSGVSVASGVAAASI